MKATTTITSAKVTFLNALGGSIHSQNLPLTNSDHSLVSSDHTPTKYGCQVLADIMLANMEVGESVATPNNVVPFVVDNVKVKGVNAN